MASSITVGDLNTKLQYFPKRKVKFRVDDNVVRFKKTSIGDDGTVFVDLVSAKKLKSSK
jgi:hypothetical protein